MMKKNLNRGRRRESALSSSAPHEKPSLASPPPSQYEKHRILDLWIPMRPSGQERVRFMIKRSRRGIFGIAYKSAKARRLEAWIRNLIQEAYRGDPEKGPIAIFIDAYLIPPKRNQYLHFPLKRPDIDNIAKLIIDCCSKIAFEDDKQICSLYAQKCFADREGISINIFKIVSSEKISISKEIYEGD